MKDTLYLVIPCYNEEEVLHETAKRLLEKITNMIENEFISDNSKILFVNDGSKDKTWSIIENFTKKILYFLELTYHEIEDIKMHY